LAIAFVVPCYNEAKRTNFETFKSWQRDHPEVSFYFVNDGSSDNTLEVLKNSFDDAFLLNLSENSGKAEAVRLGMVKVSELAHYSHIGFFDADLATPLDELPEFVKKAESGFKVILGSRILRLGGQVKRKWYRHYLGRLFATVASSILKLPVYDTQCGAKLFDSKVLKEVITEPFISKWIFDVELIFRLRNLEAINLNDYYEVPLSSWEDVGGTSLKWTDFLKAPFELWQLFMRY